MGEKKAAVFFDRDGVININHGYVHKADNFDWVEGAKEAIKYLNDKGTLVFIFTNQSGVARGFYQESDVQALHHWMQQELAKVGAHVDQFAYCPHHPEGIVEEYAQSCDCRKPEPGMLLSLLEQWPVDREKSFVVGDHMTDLQAGAAAGFRGLLFTEGRLDQKIIAFEQNLLKECDN
jgi:D-glycero-D-manno-heptose 1,7-bisphosphate phosphatase